LLRSSRTAILELLQDKAKEFKDYRDGNCKLIDRLNPVVQVVHAFSGLLSEALSSVSPSSSDTWSQFYDHASRYRSNQQKKILLASMFSSLHVSLLLQLFSTNICFFQAAIAVGACYDALVDLFDCVGKFLTRLHIYIETPSTSTMSDIVVKITVEVLSVLALATKQVRQG
jgi:hypothetical protein